MGIQEPNIIVTCDFPGCGERINTFCKTTARIDNVVVVNNNWVKVDVKDSFHPEYFCPPHGRWFSRRSVIVVVWENA